MKQIYKAEGDRSAAETFSGRKTICETADVLPVRRAVCKAANVFLKGGMICKVIFIFSSLFFWVVLVTAGGRSLRDTCMQEGISREVLRFHVLANSDSREDQSVKLKVRDGILQWLEDTLTEEELNNREQMMERIEELLPQVEQKAGEIAERNNASYTAKAQLGTSWFPVKTYGNCTFPAGNYTALRILLGKAEGQNWWCVLFPRLCFLDCVHAVLPEESGEQLKNVLTEEEYESLFDPAKDDYRISFRYF